MYKASLFPFALLVVLTCSCDKPSTTLFRRLSADKTGIDFENTIQESDSFNILTQEYIYNGGGVGVADFNNDGLQDIFFAGNAVPNRLYLNRGNLAFEDVTATANVTIPGRWNSGVAIADVNQDGKMDIYVCATMKPDSADRKNMLFINKGLNEQGLPVFADEAEAYGVTDGGYSVTAAFLDYDRDSDLDLFVLINQRMDHLPTNYRPKIADGTALNNDRLYRNNGNGTFTDVSVTAGITLEGFGLGLSVADLNLDGWPDLYISNDYLSNDVLYMNQRDGTFRNKIAEYVGHQSQFSMGNDAGDINNDGRPDIITVDMLPENNDRKKTTISNKSYLNYIHNEKYGYEYQYVRNMLHLNNGFEKGIKFSEIGQMAGVYQTEWSWSPLFADIDNDGYKDLLVTNGFPKDVTDKDFSNYRNDVGKVASAAQLIDSIPVVRIPNYAFRNNGDLTFTDATKAWGLDVPSFSNGAAYADFDNDGDLDYVVSDINEAALFFENTLYTPDSDAPPASNFLRVRFPQGVMAVGAKVWLRDGNRTQYQEYYPSRGFLSTVEPTLHFGLGASRQADTVWIAWPDGTLQQLVQVPANQVLDVTAQANAPTAPRPAWMDRVAAPLLAAAPDKVAYRHEEEDKIDFNLQRTLPHKFSQAGPALCSGDINGDGLDDVVIGASANQEPAVFIQKKDGTFQRVPQALRSNDKQREMAGMLLFDADLDGDLDLYVSAGSVENAAAERYRHSVYINNGKGQFTEDADRLPVIQASSSCVRAADYDADGDLDLFVGGRVIPGSYPLSPDSYLLQNQGGRFTDVTESVAPALRRVGMVTDALWSDIDNDGRVDLVVAGEFMPITFFRNQSGMLQRIEQTGVETSVGWWNSLVAGDFDEDGDTDYLAGNLGENNGFQVTKEYPLRLTAKDVDGNGSIDPVLACYMKTSMTDDTKRLFPVHFWDEINSQSPKFRNKYARYKQYSKVTMQNLLSPEELKDVVVLEANQLRSAYIENGGGGRFTLHALPMAVQVAPVNGMVTTDVNRDGHQDVLLVGNDYGNEVFAGRYDAFTGLVLLGDGKGAFRVVPSEQSGFYVPGDAKALVRVPMPKGELFLASQNRDSLKVFQVPVQGETRHITPGPLDCRLEVVYTDGRKQRVELFYGAGYLSQSSRQITLSGNVREATLYTFGGVGHKAL
ncbi:FG-GAP-like repeat-containing protein [Parachryseolinea silvisoli]|uniref:FG-GAP-like repeat-containing protein n=1 Tax=Parachryseolinea silvisoli TaxID=2873601 RepID=UPI002265886F|nr:FG-GAP-like repeat-containing protein [Parachryseolinea silvisoli]MCD9014045.1 FG-GAP-like repeat-containing protein [Parachryseolinea silvisoli]